VPASRRPLAIQKRNGPRQRRGPKFEHVDSVLDQAPSPPLLFGGAVHVIWNMHVAGLQVTVPGPSRIAAQSVPTGRLGSHCSPFAASIIPLPHDPPAAPFPLMPRVEASTHWHCVFQVPVGMQVLTATYIGAGHCGAFCGHGSAAVFGMLWDIGMHDIVAGLAASPESSPPHDAAPSTDISTTTPKPNPRVYMVYIIRTNAPANTRGALASNLQDYVITRKIGDGPL
jgi:hypothetical protein